MTGRTPQAKTKTASRPGRPRLCAVVVLLAVSAAIAAPSDQSKPTEYAVKSAYLYNFGKFVKWPADSKPGKNPAFSICVLGQDPFGNTLDATVEGETISGKPAVVKRISSLRDASSCNILYVAPSEAYRLAEVLAAVKESTLTVSDIPDFTKRGGMIEFVLDSGRVRFAINLAAAQEAGLNVSSELLKVAMNVRGR